MRLWPKRGSKQPTVGAALAAPVVEATPEQDNAPAEATPKPEAAASITPDTETAAEQSHAPAEATLEPAASITPDTEATSSPAVAEEPAASAEREKSTQGLIDATVALHQGCVFAAALWSTGYYLGTEAPLTQRRAILSGVLLMHEQLERIMANEVELTSSSVSASAKEMAAAYTDLMQLAQRTAKASPHTLSTVAELDPRTRGAVLPEQMEALAFLQGWTSEDPQQIALARGIAKRLRGSLALPLD